MSHQNLAESGNAEKSPNVAREPHLLLIEDDYISQAVISEMTKRLGCRPTVAVDGVHALELLGTAMSEGWMYDLVLTDLNMPRMNGYAIAESIRAIGLDRDELPVIAVSIHDDVTSIQRSAEAGMQAHLCKPVILEQLQQTLSTWMKDFKPDSSPQAA